MPSVTKSREEEQILIAEAKGRYGHLSPNTQVQQIKRKVGKTKNKNRSLLQSKRTENETLFV